MTARYLRECIKMVTVKIVKKALPIGVYLLSLAVFVYGIKTELLDKLSDKPGWFYLSPLLLALFSLTYLNEKPRFFGGLSLFSGFMIAIFYWADVKIPVVFAIGLLLSLIATVLALPKAGQPVSLVERAINISIGLVSLITLLEVLNIVWPDEIKLYIFSLAIVGILLLSSRNRKLSIAGIPLLALFYGTLSYTIYTFNYFIREYWWISFAISLALPVYSLFPLRKVMRG